MTPVGNRFTAKPTVSRKDPVRGIRFPERLLEAFQRAAKRLRPPQSLNAWVVGACEERLAREDEERKGDGK